MYFEVPASLVLLQLHYFFFQLIVVLYETWHFFCHSSYLISTTLVILSTTTEFSLNWSPNLSILEVSFSIASTRVAFGIADGYCEVFSFEGGAVIFVGVTGEVFLYISLLVEASIYE